jgi:DNA-binding NtrC family response regulator
MILWTRGTPDMPGPRLLLVDDDVNYCSDLSLVLGNSFLVEMVHDGVAALEHLKSSTPDIILLDVNLGEDQMSGLEILEHIRVLDGAPPVIMLSGNQDLEMVVQAIKMGAFHYAAKPADLPQLLNLVDKALSSRNSSLVIQAHREDLLESLNTKPDVLLLVGDDSTEDQLDPSTVLEAAEKIGCRVILLGDWSAAWRSHGIGSVVSLPRIPRPGKLVQIVKGQAETG